MKRFILLALPAAILATACENPVQRDDHDHEEEVIGVVVTDLDGTVIAGFEDGSWAGGPLELEAGNGRDVVIWFVGEDGDHFQLPPSDDEHTLQVAVEDPSVAEFRMHDGHGRFNGLAAGETTALIQLYHASHVDWQANPGLPIRVVR